MTNAGSLVLRRKFLLDALYSYYADSGNPITEFPSSMGRGQSKLVGIGVGAEELGVSSEVGGCRVRAALAPSR